MGRRDGRSMRGVKLGATRAGLRPRPMRRSRRSQRRRSTAVGPGTDRLRYPGRGCTIGASTVPPELPRSLLAFYTRE